MKGIIIGGLMLLASCGGPPPIHMNTPQERAIVKLIKSHMSDTSSYVPRSVHKNKRFSRQEIRTELFGPLREKVEDDLREELDVAAARRDTVAYLHILDRLVDIEKRYMRLYCNTSLKEVGNHYDHQFEYTDRDGEK